MYLLSNRRAFLLALACAGLSGKISQAAITAPRFHHESHDSAQRDEQEAEKKDDTVYEPGGDVKPPKLLHYVEPEFSPASKEAYVEGTVKISTVVTTDGKPTECRVSSGLSSEEDRTAVEALKQWTFKPGTKADRPVKVHITVEIDFHLL